MSCEVCGGRTEELARTRKHVWFGCRDCQRTWRGEARGPLPAGDPCRVAAASAVSSRRILRPRISDHGRWGTRAFTNLLANAVNFTPPGGQVSVTTTRTDTHAVATVSDTGIGIAAAFLPRMFERFEQNPQTLTFSRQGLGLGLSICRHFVEQHGGTIAASSEGPGKGATFAVTLPLERAVRSTAEDTSVSVPPGALQSIAVLLVEDDDDTRALLSSVLERYGASVIAARSAAEARTALVYAACDVLLCDLRMPDEDGLAFIRDIRGHTDEPLASIPAAAITASRLLEDRDRALAAGYQLHLQKPVEPDDLAAAIMALAHPAPDAVVH